jgi:hypothetical protein
MGTMCSTPGAYATVVGLPKQHNTRAGLTDIICSWAYVTNAMLLQLQSSLDNQHAAE